MEVVDVGRTGATQAHFWSKPSLGAACHSFEEQLQIALHELQVRTVGTSSMDTSVGRLGHAEALADMFKIIATEKRTLKPGEKLIKQGEPSTEMYLLVSGELEIRYGPLESPR